MKRVVGRPKKFATKEALEQAINEYFQDIEDKTNDLPPGIEEPITITGLAIAIGMTRKTLLDYENRGEFRDTVKEAKSYVENYAERKLFGSNSTGPIFALKNYDWSDKQELLNREVTENSEGELVDKDKEIIERYKERLLKDND
jgi:hypothetical protein